MPSPLWCDILLCHSKLCVEHFCESPKRLALAKKRNSGRSNPASATTRLHAVTFQDLIEERRDSPAAVEAPPLDNDDAAVPPPHVSLMPEGEDSYHQPTWPRTRRQMKTPHCHQLTVKTGMS